MVKVLDHKYKALLQNIPTRHVITEIGPKAELPKQIENLRNLDINNFFLLGNMESIKDVLGEFSHWLNLYSINCNILYMINFRVRQTRIL